MSDFGWVPAVGPVQVQPVSRFKSATVTSTAPLRIMLDGDTTALPFTPDLGVDPLSLAVNDRVRCELSSQKVIIVARAGGTPAVASVCRLTTTVGQSTPATGGQPLTVTWSDDTFDSGMWSASSPASIWPDKPGVWRVKAKLRFAASSAAGYVQVSLNGADNSASEGLGTEESLGPYPIAEDYFRVVNPGSDTFQTLAYSTGVSHGLIPANCLMLAEYIGA